MPRVSHDPPFTLYILLCDDGTYYTGITQNLSDRLKRHRSGRGALHTARRSDIRVVYTEIHPSRKSAIARERQIKRWSHAKKKALVKGQIDKLTERARGRGVPSCQTP